MNLPESTLVEHHDQPLRQCNSHWETYSGPYYCHSQSINIDTRNRLLSYVLVWPYTARNGAYKCSSIRSIGGGVIANPVCASKHTRV